MNLFGCLQKNMLIYRVFIPVDKMEKLKEYYIITSEANGIGSKFAIIYSFFQIPVRYFYKKFGIKYAHKFVCNVNLKNEDGAYYCGKERSYARLCSSFFEKDMKKYFQIQNGTFIDIGANCGKYTIALGNKLKETGRVISIEPETKNFNSLQINIKLNNLNNVSVRQLVIQKMVR